jgi:hypothetical protein
VIKLTAIPHTHRHPPAVSVDRSGGTSREAGLHRFVLSAIAALALLAIVTGDRSQNAASHQANAYTPYRSPIMFAASHAYWAGLPSNPRAPAVR